MVIGLNMMDVAKNRGIEMDVNKFSSLLGVPVVPIIARSGEGCDELAQMITTNKIHILKKILFIMEKR